MCYVVLNGKVDTKYLAFIKRKIDAKISFALRPKKIRLSMVEGKVYKYIPVQFGTIKMYLNYKSKS